MHDLQHTAASLTLTAGVKPRVVMEVLGHSHIGVTVNLYSHVAPNVSRAAVEGVAGLLEGDDPGAQAARLAAQADELVVSLRHLCGSYRFRPGGWVGAA